MSFKHHVPENGFVTTGQKPVHAGLKPSEEKIIENRLKKLPIYNNNLSSYDVESRLDKIRIYILDSTIYFTVRQAMGMPIELTTPFTTLEEGQEWLKTTLANHLKK